MVNQSKSLPESLYFSFALKTGNASVWQQGGWKQRGAPGQLWGTLGRDVPVSCYVRRRTRRNVWLLSPSPCRAVGLLPRDLWTPNSAEPGGDDTWQTASTWETKTAVSLSRTAEISHTYQPVIDNQRLLYSNSMIVTPCPSHYLPAQWLNSHQVINHHFHHNSTTLRYYLSKKSGVKMLTLNAKNYRCCRLIH